MRCCFESKWKFLFCVQWLNRKSAELPGQYKYFPGKIPICEKFLAPSIADLLNYIVTNEYQIDQKFPKLQESSYLGKILMIGGISWDIGFLSRKHWQECDRNYLFAKKEEFLYFAWSAIWINSNYSQLFSNCITKF